MTTDTDQLLATVRAVCATAYLGHPDDEALAALDSLAAELERVKAERDEWQVLIRNSHNERDRLLMAEARLDKALTLLRRLRQWDMLNSYVAVAGERLEPTADAPYWRGEIDRCLAEIEGEA